MDFFSDAENPPKGEEGEGAAQDEEGTWAETEPEPELTDEEESIRAYLADGEALPNETLDKILPAFWNEEPFRWDTIQSKIFLCSFCLVPYAAVIWVVTQITTLDAVNSL